VEDAIAVSEKEIEAAGADFEKLQNSSKQLEDLNKKYEHLIERWSYLQEIMGS
jgi:ATP-binding cassette subfamily F protein uup